MLRILSNADVKVLHQNSNKIVSLILETFSLNSPVDFLGLVTEIINTLKGFIYTKLNKKHSKYSCFWTVQNCPNLSPYRTN